MEFDLSSCGTARCLHLEKRREKVNHSREKLYQDALRELVAFYECNRSAFQEFEAKVGFNPWFVQHFGTYMVYRNHKLSLKESKPVKSKRKNKLLGRVRLAMSLVIESLTILLRYRSVGKFTSKYALFSNAFYEKSGQNKGLELLGFERVYNRPWPSFGGFRPSMLGPVRSKSMDNILLNYLFRFTFVKDFKSFRVSFNKLRNQVEPMVAGNEAYSKIFRIFCSEKHIIVARFLQFKAVTLMLEKSGLLGVLLSDENSSQQKIIQYAAGNCGIKTFGFQHGNIHKLHPNYMFGEYKSSPLLPTITFTWGDYFSKLLIDRGGYRSDQVMAVGRAVANKEVSPIASGSPDKKVILYASQPQRDSKMRRKLMNDVLQCAKELISTHRLIVRPHPSVVDDEFFVESAHQVGFSDFVVERNVELHSHLEQCDKLIVAFSTVGTEFIPYCKPMLVLDYLNLDLMSWVKEGVGISVKNYRNLLSALLSEDKVDRQAHLSYANRFYRTGASALEDIKKAIYAA